MAESLGGTGERQHEATGKRRQSFIEAGDLPRSQDFQAAMILCLGLWMLQTIMPVLSQHSVTLLRHHLNVSKSFQYLSTYSIFNFFGAPVGTLLSTVFLASIVASIAQNRGNLAWQKIGFNLENLNPLPKLQNIFTPKTVTLKILTGLFKSSILLLALSPLLTPLLLGQTFTRSTAIVHLTNLCAHTLITVLWRGAQVLLVFGIFDLGYQIYSSEQRMRMTTTEVRDEIKDQAGDPNIKRKRKQRMREIIKARSLKTIPKADVVVVNPSHFAVALAYQASTMQAPQVLAKGQDLLAEKIRAIARHHQIPVIPQPALARALFSQVQVGGFIPRDLYHAVALILAHVYSFKKARS